eukprot:Tamp_18716.p1 GENE.Tamp_18716~~Tamp_18716.p1  ORF type:complete len:374 (-),score=38.89 Tamp_18716:105-1226(-)
MAPVLRAKRQLALLFAVSFVSFLLLLELWGAVDRSDDRRVARTAALDGALASECPVVDPATCGSETQRARAVLAWASKRGAYVHRNITVAHIASKFKPPGSGGDGGGGGVPGSEAVKGSAERGLVTRGSISNFSRVILVPPALQISVATLRDDVSLKAVFAAIPELHGGLAGVAFYLLNQAANRSSALRPYLCSLPSHVHLPILFTDIELKAARRMVPPGQQRAFSFHVYSQRRRIRHLHRVITRALTSQFPHSYPPEDYTLPKWVWAVSIAMSRSWPGPYGEKTGGGGDNTRVHTLVPGADLPNHRSDAYDAGQSADGTLVLRAAGDLPPSTQMYVSYGSKCDAEFLTAYGFIPPNNSHVPCKPLPRAASDQ